MALEIPILIESYPAAIDMSSGAYQFTFVKLTSTGQITPCVAITDKPIGVLQDKPKLNYAGSVMLIGKTKLKANVVFTVGQGVGTDVNGLARAVTPGTDTTMFLCGQVTNANAAINGFATAVINTVSAARGA